MIRVYGLTGCGPCEVAKLFLRQKGAEFEFLDVSENAEARTKLKELVGTLSAGGQAEAILGVSIPKLEAWYSRHVSQKP